MIRPVHLRMTIHAASREQECGSAAAASRQPAAGIRDRGMAGHRVALLAEQWRGLRQQHRARRPVREVAQGAVLGHRRMFPQERPALFRVTGVAGLIHGWLHQHRRGARSMRAVTPAAGHDAEAHRMHRRLVEVREHLRVALVTDLWLGGLGKQGIALRVKLVATGACHVVDLMLAADPADAGISLMAVQTELVTLLNRKEGGRFETVYRVLAGGGGVLGAGAVAGLALKSGKRRALVGAVGMLGLENRKNRIRPLPRCGTRGRCRRRFRCIPFPGRRSGASGAAAPWAAATTLNARPDSTSSTAGRDFLIVIVVARLPWFCGLLPAASSPQE